MILIIDNYDSFTYNLVQMVEMLYPDVKVIKNDDHTIEDIRKLNPRGIILSPGPCTPNEAGICLDLVKSMYKELPILGICLGHQVIAQAFGGDIIKAKHLVHGKIEIIKHDHKGLFNQLPSDFIATRYHSLVVNDVNLPRELMITARATSDEYIMGIRHLHFPIEGFQFHPESYKTEMGMMLIKNFVESINIGGDYV